MDLVFEMYVIENDTSGVLIYCALSAASGTDKSAGNMPDYCTPPNQNRAFLNEVE